jgi:hypothetical protein
VQKRRQNRAPAGRLSTNLVVWSLAGAHALAVCLLLTLLQMPVPLLVAVLELKCSGPS